VPLATGTLQLYLANNPEAGDVTPSTGGGFRRVRWGAPRRGQGRRGPLRVIYYLFLQDSLIWFVTLYGNDEAAALTASEKRLLKAAAQPRQRKAYVSSSPSCSTSPPATCPGCSMGRAQRGQSGYSASWGRQRVQSSCQTLFTILAYRAPSPSFPGMNGPSVAPQGERSL
jgi:hypothetical protein